jgi:hypothetical protein
VKNSLTHAPYIDGNLQEYISNKYPEPFGWGYGEKRVAGEWRPNEPFRTTLFYKTWQRGRSAVRIVWENIDGCTYPMFMKDMDALLSAGRIDTDPIAGTVVHGVWQVVKRGANYGISLVTA